MRKMRTNKHIGSKIKRKWGKVGAPHSKKRREWLDKIRVKGWRSIRKKRKKRKKR